MKNTNAFNEAHVFLLEAHSLSLSPFLYSPLSFSCLVGTHEATDGSHVTWASDHEPLSCVGAEEWLCVPVFHLCPGPCH